MIADPDVNNDDIQSMQVATPMRDGGDDDDHGGKQGAVNGRFSNWSTE